MQPDNYVDQKEVNYADSHISDQGLTRRLKSQ